MRKGIAVPLRFLQRDVRVLPSLRGLVVRDPLDRLGGGLPDYFPWLQVSGRRQFWHPFDDEGRPLRHAGKRVCLVLESDWHRAIARRAQLRWFKNALERNALAFVDSYRGHLKDVVVFTLAAVGYLLSAPWMAWWFFRRAADDVWSYLPIEYKWLAATIALFFLALALGGAAMMAGLAMMFWRSDVRRLEFRPNGVTVHDGAGRTSEFWWKDLREISLRVGECVLRFGPHGDILVPERSSRLNLALVAIEGTYLAKPPEASPRQVSYRRVLGWALFVGGAAALAFAFPRDDVPPVPGWVQILVVLGSSAIAAFGASGRFALLLAQWQRRWYRRTRRRGRRRPLPFLLPIPPKT